MEKMRLTVKTALSLTIIFALLFFLIGSALVPVYEIGHSCLHDSCPVCALISSLKDLLEILETAFLAATIFGAAGIFSIRFCAKKAFSPCSLFTPVALKVKISD